MKVQNFYSKTFYYSFSRNSKFLNIFMYFVHKFSLLLWGRVEHRYETDFRAREIDTLHTRVLGLIPRNIWPSLYSQQ